MTSQVGTLSTVAYSISNGEQLPAAAVLSTALLQEQDANQSANGSAFYAGDAVVLFSAFQRAVTLSVMCGLSAVTNLLAFYKLTCDYRRNQRRLSIFWAPLINLCAADFIITTFGMGGTAAWHFTEQWLAGDFMCRFVKYVQVLGNNASTYIIMFISVDRAVAVTRPMTNLSGARSRIRFFLISAWLLAALGSMPQWFIFSVVEAPPPYERGFYQCYSLLLSENMEMSLLYSLIVCVFSFIIPFIVMIVAYTLILTVIRKKSKQDPSVQCDGDETERLTSHSAPRAHSSSSSPSVKKSFSCNFNWRRCFDKNRPPTIQPAASRQSQANCHNLLVQKANGKGKMSRTHTVESSFTAEAEVANAKSHNGTPGTGTGTGTGRTMNDNRNVWFKRAKQKSLKTFLIIITSFLICWIPYYCLFLAFTIRNYARYLLLSSNVEQEAADAADSNNLLEEAVASWTGLFAMLNPLVNPIIYGSFQFNCLTRLQQCLAIRKPRNMAALRSTNIASATKNVSASYCDS